MKLTGIYKVIITTGLAVLSMTSTASTVLDFEDVTTYSANWFPSEYKGITWGEEKFGVISDNGWDYGYQKTFGNSYGSTSGEYAIYNTFGDNRSLSFNGVVDFIGANFSTWAVVDMFAPSSATSITLSGFKNNQLIKTVSMDLSSNRYDWFAADITGIDRLDFITSGPSTWWLMDDFSFDRKGSDVPAPHGIPLLLLGMLVLFFKRNLLRS